MNVITWVQRFLKIKELLKIQITFEFLIGFFWKMSYF